MENSIDLGVLTETWLSDTEADQVWLQCSSLNNDDIKCVMANRQGRRGGGLVLISKDRYKIVSLGAGQLQSFQFAKWRIRLKHTMLMVLEIYNPPYSDQSQTPNLDFSDNFTDWIAEHTTNDTNVIILGDFDLHVNNPNDDNAMNFIETNQSLALEQHFIFPTDTSGNTLDLVLTELFNGLKYHSVLRMILSPITAL